MAEKYIYNSPPITLPDRQSEEPDCNRYLLLGVMLFFLAMCIITIGLCYFYVHLNLSTTLTHARRLRRRTRAVSRARRFSSRLPDFYFSTSATEGLRREVVDALPVFVCRPENLIEGLSCAVCLSEFEENEKAKLLPNCNHSFHVECVNMWFYSHSTCPLCRASVEKQSDEHVEVSSGEVVDGKEVTNSKSGSSASAAQAEDVDNEGVGVKKEEQAGVTIDID